MQHRPTAIQRLIYSNNFFTHVCLFVVRHLCINILCVVHFDHVVITSHNKRRLAWLSTLEQPELTLPELFDHITPSLCSPVLVIT